jgi:nucleoside 2-deoxyribosyltransferase
VQEKRYTVFISSTFVDLKDERRAVQDAIISSGDFPYQMESFPASDEEQFNFIKALIDKCDYYVLIIAGRYGAVAEDGKSYTEKEFDYAVENGIPVLAMIHEDRGSISTDKSEKDDAGRAALDEFIKKVETGRLRKGWKTTDGLKLAVREALDNAKLTRPATGWVRAKPWLRLKFSKKLTNFVNK